MAALLALMFNSVDNRQAHSKEPRRIDPIRAIDSHRLKGA